MDEGQDVDGFESWDAGLARLEDVLLAAPLDRALPDLDDLLEQAKVPLSLVQHDERALKLINEALLARPFATRDEVARTRQHLEMMALEVEVLTERLADPDTDAATRAQSLARLDEVRRQLSEVRDLL